MNEWWVYIVSQDSALNIDTDCGERFPFAERKVMKNYTAPTYLIVLIPTTQLVSFNSYLQPHNFYLRQEQNEGHFLVFVFIENLKSWIFLLS